MRHFKDGQTLVIEPWRAKAFPLIKDLVVDRRSFDRIIASGGYISVSTGSAPDGNAIPVPKEAADESMDAAACIGCGACVAACPNASAALFTGAKMTHLGVLPQGEPERHLRALKMVDSDELRRLRWLHQHRRMHRRLPESDSAIRHRPHESRLPHRQLGGTR
jgi:succinate dehydrogenase / fumarate reductase iron-sulfur subunit